MPWATFTKDYNYRTPRKAVIAYPAGYKGNITQKAYEAAKAAGAIEEVNDEEQVSEG
ncbi:hypothetical protein [Aureimonas altamirensis]|uniref:hypothetical protein n=1 Tax=Aureimonas altamirensis TaxID=370622 RepID=UPI00301A6E30